MVLKVFTDTGQIMDNIDAMFTQMGCRTNTRKHQKLWRVDRTGRNDHFTIYNRALVFAVMEKVEADGAFSFENNILRKGLVINGQVRTLHRRMQIGARG